MKKGLITTASILVMLLLWQALSTWVNQPLLVPGIPELAKTLTNLFASPDFYLSVGVTILRGIAGMFISLVCAFVFAFFFSKVEWLYELFRPMLAIMRSVPVISFILLALIFLHTESIPLLIGFLTMFPLLTENITKGIISLRHGFVVMSRSFLVGKRNKLCLVAYPQLKPFLYSGLASAAGFGWRAIIMGEVLAQTSLGIGSEMKRAQSFIAVSDLIAWTLIAILISYTSDRAIHWLSKQKYSIRFREREIPKTTASPIQLHDVSYKYAIKDYSLTIDLGKVYGISAPSGKGKTTLLNLINGSLTPVKGEIEIDRQHGIASVFQELELLPNLTAIENIMLVLARNHAAEEARKIALQALQEVEIKEFADRLPTELSIGQQQRIAIARALVFPSPYLIMDEPFRGIDKAVCDRIIEQLRLRQRAKKQTIIFTSHNQEELKSLAEEVVTL